ncbi:MAG: hypothetical protein CMO55_06995 [Verrucomicrobiales bacterium]|nr:hypothetical protein [Verrucomicrobiales bacterium]
MPHDCNRGLFHSLRLESNIPGLTIESAEVCRQPAQKRNSTKSSDLEFAILGGSLTTNRTLPEFL